MTILTDRSGRRALDRFAVRRGYSDIDVFLAAGNSLLEARELLFGEMKELQLAMSALKRLNFPAQLIDMESEQTGEPVAAIQGDDA